MRAGYIDIDAATYSDDMAFEPYLDFGPPFMRPGGFVFVSVRVSR